VHATAVSPSLSKRTALALNSQVRGRHRGRLNDSELDSMRRSSQASSLAERLTTKSGPAPRGHPAC
jgi:hypothetical protein